MVINSVYNFQIKAINDQKQVYSIEALSKFGNHDMLNLVFEYFEAIDLNKIGPVDNASGYIAYSVKKIGSLLEYEPIIFETSIQSQAFGLVRSLKKDDAILFKMSHGGMLEVYVFNNKYSSRLLLLQMLRDGAFDHMIEEINEVINALL
ncbi:MAG: hypothetical protein WC623_00855 [Pedobacter sp.]|uniref:hypothetical protein n=1 Tax=Pedobacter sp. TaxID=1411316 RepID=UPI00356491E8